MILTSLRADLKAHIDPHTLQTSQRFFKETIKFYGVSVPVTGKISNQYLPEVKKLSKDQVFKLCEDLLASGYLEESFVACDWAYSQVKHLTQQDFPTLEKWVDTYVTNWATCDTLCNHTIGAFLEKYPTFIQELKTWTKSSNRWKRRAAAVSLIVPAKHGKYLKDAIEIADLLLLDKDDLVQKGYGWLLKEESRLHQQDVFDYVVGHKKEMPRTALRYAIEKMPEPLRKKAMEK